MNDDQPSAGSGDDDDPPAIRADGLTKRYGRFPAVDSVSFSVADGETVGFFGPNGAGKSTTLRMLAGLVQPTAGTVHFEGTERSFGDSESSSGVGVVTHDAMVYDDLTARENLRFHARLHGVDGVDTRVEAVLDDVGLADRGSRLPATFSHGLRKRLSLARALLHDPDVLLLDEPYSGLDQRGVADLGRILDGVDDRTVLLSTHNLELGLDRCSRALVLDRGRIQADRQIASTSPSEFEAAYRRAIGLDAEHDNQATGDRSTALDQR